MQKKNPELGPLGAKFFAYAQAHKIDIVRLGDIQKPLGLTSIQERRLFERLNKVGLVFRIQRGVYIVPEKLTAGGFWRPNDYLIIAVYMELHQANYYLGGLSAFNRHGFSSQIPMQLTVYNDKISGSKKFGKLVIKFIKVAKRCITSFDSLAIHAHQKNIHIASLAKTILDAINDCNRYKTVPEAYLWLKKYCADKKFLKNFIILVTKSANNNAVRRIGFYLEQQGIGNETLKPLLKRISPTQAWITLIPNKKRRGKTNKKWGIINNAK